MKKIDYKIQFKSTNLDRPMDLGSLLLKSAKGALSKKILKPKKVNFPKKIGEYKFVKEFEKQGIKKSFLIGIYKNISGKKAIAKIWTGAVKDYNYYTFKNEIYMYQILNQAKKRIASSKSAKFKNMYLPKLLSFKENQNSLMMLIEFVKGDLASKLGSKEKLKVYLQTIDYIRFLGKNLYESEKKYISERASLHYIILYPLLLIKALYSNPFASRNLLKGVPVFLNCLPSLIKDNQKVLVHRDLHFNNILISKKQITLIDLQFCVFTQVFYELITTLRYRWMEDDFYKLLLKKILKDYSKNDSFNNLFRGLSVISVTHGLTDNKFTFQKREKWSNFLNFVTNSKFGIT